ncbi:glycosyltransferase [Vibrio metschnikovii]|nr:glycosyltransferase [Vibrio metschnikovii]
MLAEQIAEIFDSHWYLERYPDVAAAGVNAWQHFLAHGCREQRLPCALPAFEWESILWQQPLQQAQALAALKTLFRQSGVNQSLAGFVLARFYVSEGQFEKVCDYLQPMLSDPLSRLLVAEQAPWLLQFSALYHQNRQELLADLFADANWPDGLERQLAIAMNHGKEAAWQVLQQAWQRLDLTMPTALFDPTNKSQLLLEYQQITQAKSADSQVGWRRYCPWFYTVSVIIPCFNAEQTIDRALACVAAQSWPHLEIIVVDDASQDNSVEVIKQWQARDTRIKLIQQPDNQGAYAARNLGMQQAKGHWLTVHDADDWSHPQKIERQLQGLFTNPQAVASVSHWIRCDEALQFQRWRMEESWIFRNISSLLIKRSVLAELGFWDNASVNADTEYYYRLLHTYGLNSVVEVMPGVPLSLGIVCCDSLTQQTVTHLRTQFYGVRKEYHDSALAWHQNMQGQLPLSADVTVRPFAVPPRLCKGPAALQRDNFMRYVRNTGWVDEAWYWQRYPDVAAAQMNAVDHYLEHGWREGRDPCAHFSGSAYTFLHPESSAENPLWHRLYHDPNSPPLPISVLGDLKVDAVQYQPAVVYVGHQVSNQQFGAERSFVQILQQLAVGEDWLRQGYRIEVVLPAAANRQYVEQVMRFCHRVTFIPTAWWHQERETSSASLQTWSTWLEWVKAKVVYVNTLVVDLPLLAARQLGIPTAVHVRELPEHDPSLCQALGASPSSWLAHFDPLVDVWIANSQTVAQWLTAKRQPIVWQTPWLFDEKSDLPLPDQARLQVGMVSSNLAKKGIWDMLQVAQLAANQQLPLDFYLYGPHTDEVSKMQQQDLPPNWHFAGYVDQPQQALAQLDVVLSLSHFHESFGRTLLEALGAGRVVIAYAQGSMVEWAASAPVYWASYPAVAEVLEHLAALCADREQLQQRAEQGKQWAKQQASCCQGEQLWLGQLARFLNQTAIH